MPSCSTCFVEEARVGRSTCRKCYNAYMRTYNRARYHQKRAETIAYLGSVCVDCGSAEDLEFDHVDRNDKSFDVSKIWAYSVNRFKAEIDKCVLRCGSCHQVKTTGELAVEHGGGLTGRRNCYCELCRPLKVAYNRDWYLRKRKNL